MPTTIIQANQVIPGDVLADERLIVLAAEPKQIDGRIRFVLLMENGTRINRTYPAYTNLEVIPLGAARVVQESAALQEAVGRFMEAFT